MDTKILFGVIIVGTIGLATIFGTYLARMITFEMRPLEKTLARVESGFYRIIGIDAPKQMREWKEYFLALLMNNFTNYQRLCINNQFINFIRLY